eukprot:jgi/Mesvir1/25445/Mv25790-RA.1
MDGRKQDCIGTRGFMHKVSTWNNFPSQVSAQLSPGRPTNRMWRHQGPEDPTLAHGSTECSSQPSSSKGHRAWPYCPCMHVSHADAADTDGTLKGQADVPPCNQAPLT